MSSATPTRFRLDDLIIDLTRQRVTRAEVVLDVAGLSFRLLGCLLRRGVDVVPFDTLIAEVWAPAVVNEETVTQRVKLLRQALGDDGRQPRYVRSVRGRGYQLCAMPEALADEHAQSPRDLRHRHGRRHHHRGRMTARQVVEHRAVVIGEPRRLGVVPDVHVTELEHGDVHLPQGAGVEELSEVRTLRVRLTVVAHGRMDEGAARTGRRGGLDNRPDEAAAIQPVTHAVEHVAPDGVMTEEHSGGNEIGQGSARIR